MFVTANNLIGVEPFFIEFEQTYLHGDMLLGDTSMQPDLLLLHGQHFSQSRSRFFMLRQFLLKQYGLSSCMFDFMGHGNTSGDGSMSSLQHRTRQAQEIIDACFDSQPFSIVAVGQGAYTALQLTEMADVRHLVLLSPEISSDADRQECAQTARDFRGNICLMTDQANPQANLQSTTQQAAIQCLCGQTSLRSGRRQIIEHWASNSSGKSLMVDMETNSAVLMRVAEVIASALI